MRKCAIHKGRYLVVSEAGGESFYLYEPVWPNIQKNPPTTWNEQGKKNFIECVESFFNENEDREEVQVKDLEWINLDLTDEILNMFTKLKKGN